MSPEGDGEKKRRGGSAQGGFGDGWLCTRLGPVSEGVNAQDGDGDGWLCSTGARLHY